MKTKEFLTEAKERLNKEEYVPPFFKKIRMIAVYIVAIAVTIESVAAGGLYIPEWLIIGAAYAIAIGAAMGITSQFTSVRR